MHSLSKVRIIIPFIANEIKANIILSTNTLEGGIFYGIFRYQSALSIQSCSEVRLMINPKAHIRGFTLIELLVVITIIGILAAIALPNYIKAKDKAKEVEVKANIHTIQIALERYATDNRDYPAYLIGGDNEGWLYWHRINDPVEDENMLVRDPLISWNYIESYPQNPFMEDGTIVIDATSIIADPQQGDGDPRFGYRGDIMGNGVEDFFFYHYREGGYPTSWTSTIETRRTLPEGLTFSDTEDTTYGMGLHYMFGGHRQWYPDGGMGTIFTFWPGNFFYRCGGFHSSNQRAGWTYYDPGYFLPGRIDRYILGGYGCSRNEGWDVIRYEYQNPDGDQLLYRQPPPWPTDPNPEFGGWASIRLGWPPWPGGGGCGLPEVAGGGDPWHGPYFPYDSGPKRDWMWGAPDGHRDGVIHIATGGTDSQKFD